jgi:nucleoside-diphosphate-sugar epimerase
MHTTPNIDLFGGTGFIGSNFYNLYKDEVYIHPRNHNVPYYKNILYMISTTDNYNIFEDPYKDININLIKLIDVLDNCKNKDIIFNFISSWFVYGDVDLPAKESSCCNPKGFYSITKKCAEDLLISYCKTFNIKYRILRLANVYGNNDFKASNKKNALIYLINKIKNNEEISLYFNGNFTRDYIHVEDACKAIKLCLEKGQVNDIYNIGNGEPIIFKDIIDYVLKQTNSKSNIISVDQPEFHKIVQVKDMYLNTTKINNLGFKKNIDIYQGISKLL